MDAINAVVAPMSLTHSFTATTRGGFGRGTPLSDSKQTLPTLRRHITETLGGAERISRDAPVHRVEPFDDGALYLQLTAEPEPITTPTMQAGLLALEQLLQPVLVPLPPYWATRAANRAKK